MDAAGSRRTDGGASRAQFARSAHDLAVDDLPVLPAVVVRLMAMSPESDQFFEEVLTIASADPGLALRVIRTANSPMSAPRSPVETTSGWARVVRVVPRCA
jgi:HD-like signal output (HDOD) protein